MRVLPRTLLTAVALWLLAGCDVYDRPRRPLPESLTFRTLEGATVSRAELLGKPWVINVWVPG